MKKILFIIIILLWGIIVNAQSVESIHHSVGVWIEDHFEYNEGGVERNTLEFTFNTITIGTDVYKIVSSPVKSSKEGKWTRITYQCTDLKNNKCSFAWTREQDGTTVVEITYFEQKRIRYLMMLDSKLPLL